MALKSLEIGHIHCSSNKKVKRLLSNLLGLELVPKHSQMAENLWTLAPNLLLAINSEMMPKNSQRAENTWTLLPNGQNGL